MPAPRGSDGSAERVAAVTDDIRKVARAVDALGLRPVTVPEDLTAQKAGQLITVGTALRDHLATGKALRSRFPGTAQRNARELLDSCTVDGRSPQTTEGLDAVLAHLRACCVLAGAAMRWQQVNAAIPQRDVEVRLAELTARAQCLEHVQTFGSAGPARLPGRWVPGAGSWGCVGPGDRGALLWFLPRGADALLGDRL